MSHVDLGEAGSDCMFLLFYRHGCPALTLKESVAVIRRFKRI